MAKARALKATDEFEVTQVDPYSHDSTAAAVARLAALVEAQARAIRNYQTAMARSHEVFEHAAAADRLGLWECDLTTEVLQWSPGTYDMFGIARDAPLKRGQALIRYPAHALKKLETIRSRAIAERSGFNLDTEIVTPDGGCRWIRITATVECNGAQPTRLFGLKQDITEAKKRWERTRYLAAFDELTGLANRSHFNARLAEACGDETGHNAAGALLLVDLDGFKEVNDTLGHTAGDVCLKEVARRLSAACATAVVVARIGGDEFAILLDPLEGRGATLLAKQIIAAIRQPIRYAGHRFHIGASIGLAAIRGCQPGEALRWADTALYAAKAAGRNTARWFDASAMRL